MEPGEKIKQARELRGWSQKDLADRVGVSQVAIKKIESSQTRQSKFLPKIARVLELDLAEIDPSFHEGDEPAEQNAPLPESKLLLPGRDFPIYAAAEGGPGEIIRSADPIDWHPRPAPVAHVKNAYGLFVVGESMSPEFEPGDIALINPALPPLTGKPCIFYAEMHGEARATIKRFVRANNQNWFVYQHNPPRGGPHEFTLPRREWGICHRVLGKYYPQ